MCNDATIGMKVHFVSGVKRTTGFIILPYRVVLVVGVGSICLKLFEFKCWSSGVGTENGIVCVPN